MMPSQTTCYEDDLKNKSETELLTIIEELNKQIEQLKFTMEHYY